jgi:hypothetical protein
VNDGDLPSPATSETRALRLRFARGYQPLDERGRSGCLASADRGSQMPVGAGLAM